MSIALLALSALLAVVVAVFGYVARNRVSDRGHSSEVAGGEVLDEFTKAPQVGRPGYPFARNLVTAEVNQSSGSTATAHEPAAGRVDEGAAAPSGFEPNVPPSSDEPKGTAPEESVGEKAPGATPKAGSGVAALFQELDGALSPLRGSGPAEPQWSERATRALDSIAGAVPPGLTSAIVMSAVECHAGGCAVEMRFSDMKTFRRASFELMRNSHAAFNRWPGDRERIVPITLASGEVVSGWILRRL